MRFRLGVVVLIVGTMFALGSASAITTSSRAPTLIYFGEARVGVIEPGGVRRWSVDCTGPEGDEVFLGARGRALWVRHWDGYLDGYAQLENTNRWAIWDYVGGKRKAAGFAGRRTSSRWDVVRGRRRVGHTIGPDGPEAGATLLTAC